MSGGILGVAGDILSVAFLCFICSLAIQLYCAFSRRRSTTRPPTPLPAATTTTPPPQLPPPACKQLYLFRFQRSPNCPVVSTIAPPPSPPNNLRSAYHVSSMAYSPLASDANPLARTVASQAHTADLAKLMQLQNGEEHDVDVENFICVPPPRMLFTIKEEGKDEGANERSNVESGTSAEDSGTDSTCRNDPASADELDVPSLLEKQVITKCVEPHAKGASSKCAHAPANGSATGANAPAAGLLSQVSSASSEGGVSLWSSTSPCPSSPAVSYLSASSSPFPTSSPPRSSFWAQPSSRFRHATNC